MGARRKNVAIKYGRGQLEKSLGQKNPWSILGGQLSHFSTKSFSYITLSFSANMDQTLLGPVHFHTNCHTQHSNDSIKPSDMSQFLVYTKCCQLCQNDNSYFNWTLGCFTKTLFPKKNNRNPPRISLGVNLKGSKRIFDFDNV